MPYVFSYRDTRRPELEEFLCEVKSKRCRGISSVTGTRCRKNCAIGLPYCWMHLLKIKNLKIGPSTLMFNGQSVGKGLFAAKNTKLNQRIQGDDGIVFEPDDEICDYEGEKISQSILDNRYGKNTRQIIGYPPYAIRVRRTQNYEDGACRRGVGNLPNHKDNNTNASIEIEDQTDRIFIKAETQIRHGDEIFVNYGYNNFNLPFITYSTKQASRNSKKYKKAKQMRSREKRKEKERLERAEVANQRRIQRSQAERRRSTRRRA
jgi:hypothetical protein